MLKRILHNVSTEIEHSGDMLTDFKHSVHGWGQNMHIACPSQRYFMFFDQAYSDSGTLGRREVRMSSDILVGFYSREKTTIDVEIGPDIRYRLDVDADSFVYALDDACVLPMVCLRFHCVRITFPGRAAPFCLQLILDTDERRRLCFECQSFRRRHSVCVFKHGMAIDLADPTPSHESTDRPPLPNMRAFQTTFLLDSAIVDRLLSVTAKFSNHGLSLQEVPEVMALLRLPCATGRVIVGARATVGNSNLGMHEHRDGSYQGGDASMLIYLTDVEEGGETVFPESGESFRPRRGLVVIFDIWAPHHANPVIRGEKLVVSCEIMRSPNLYRAIEKMKRRHAMNKISRYVTELKFRPEGAGYLAAMEDFERSRT